MVRVTCRWKIDTSRPSPVDSRTEITADNLLGDKYINIRKGIASESIKAGDELLTQPASNSFDPAI